MLCNGRLIIYGKNGTDNQADVLIVLNREKLSAAKAFVYNAQLSKYICTLYEVHEFISMKNKQQQKQRNKIKR
jgi:hypothetical protein